MVPAHKINLVQSRHSKDSSDNILKFKTNGGIEMRAPKTVFTMAIFMIAIASPAVAITPSSSIVKLTVSANSGNMPMSANSKMTTAMTGSASGKFVINTNRNTFCYLITSKGLQNMTEAHVQLTSTEKDILIFNPKNINVRISTCMKVSHTSLLSIVSHPARYSFMIHAKADPNGAVMGNLMMSK